MTYVEFPVDNIVGVHWFDPDDPPTGGGGPGGTPGPCEDYDYVGDAGVHIIHVNLGAAGTGTEGTWLQPTDMPPVDWQQIGPPTWDNSIKGSQVYVPGNSASRSTISVAFVSAAPPPGLTFNFEYWVRPGTAWTDPAIWNSRPADGGIDFFSPSGTPTNTVGAAGGLEVVVDRAPLVPAPGNPHNFGTTIQILLTTTTGGAASHRIPPAGTPRDGDNQWHIHVHHVCPEAAS